MLESIETRIKELEAEEQNLKAKVHPPHGETIAAKAQAFFFAFCLIALLGGLLNAFVQGINFVNASALITGSIGTYWWHRADKEKASNKEALTHVRLELKKERSRQQSRRLQQPTRSK